MDTIYLDHNATTPVNSEVLEAMMPYFTLSFGNPSSVRYELGRRARKAVDEARFRVSLLLNCKPDEILFTCSGSEANTQAVLGSGPIGGLHPRIITSGIEHPSVRQACRWARNQGSELVELAPTAAGFVAPESLEAALERRASLVTLVWVNNETGVVQPIEVLARLAKERGALFHTDAVQAAGKIAIDLERVPADLLSISGHKLGAPKGIGALFIRERTPQIPLRPIIFGGEQEKGLRAGTESVPLIVALGKACEIVLRERDDAVQRERRLRDRLEHALTERCPGAVVHGATAERVANTLCIGWRGLHSDDLLRALDQNSICASSGSACTTLQLDPSHVLLSMGVDPDLARGTLRFSLGPETTEAEIDRVAFVMEHVLQDLREELEVG
jgi:cysteine desulfurase